MIASDEQDQILKTKTAAYKTKTTGSKQRHLVDLIFKWVNATVDPTIVMFQALNYI